MDEVAREVLKKLKSEIKRNLNLDDEILDNLEATDTLTSDHVEQIKVGMIVMILLITCY